MAELDTMYRIMVLYMLDQIEHPLTNTQITNFVLEKEYTSYFTIQEVLSDLLSSKLILAEDTHNNIRYRLSEEGRYTLNFFEDKITDSMKEDIREFLTLNKYELKQETSIYADYLKSSAGGYTANCCVKEKQNSILNLSIHVSTREQAEAICHNWTESSDDVYAALMDILLK